MHSTLSVATAATGRRTSSAATGPTSATIAFSTAAPLPHQSQLAQQFAVPLSSAEYGGAEGGEEGGGFVGLGITKPRHWVDLARAKSREAERIMSSLSSVPPPTPQQIVMGMDAISDILCLVADPAELCRNVHPDADMVQGATDAVIELHRVIAVLNTHEGLYQASLVAVEHREDLTAEEFDVINKLRIEFEHNGVHLPPTARSEVLELSNELQHLSTEYTHLLNNHEDAAVVVLPKAVVSQLRLPARRVRAGPTADTRQVVMDSALYRKLMASPLEVVREAAYRAEHAPGEHLTKLEQFVNKRHQLASLLGFPSFSHMSSWQRQLKEPAAIDSFLKTIAKTVRSAGDREVEAMLKLKRKQDPSATQIQAWDMRFAPALDLGDLNSYLSFANCLHAIELLCESLFGIKLRIVELAPHEGWHPSVRKMVAHDSSGFLGVIYLDLFDRPGKYPGAAVFQVRPSSMHHERGSVVSLVMNIAGAHHHPPEQLGDLLVTDSLVETLFHEFGHCLQNFLSRTRYQHTSGTRTYIDWVETPSTLMEYFSFDPRIMPLWATHSHTGAAIPPELIDGMKQKKLAVAAMNVQTQVFQAMLDNDLYSKSLSASRTSTDVARMAYGESMSIPFPDGTAWHAKFGHLVGYGAAYYSYLYCNSNSAAIWEHLFQDEPLSRAAGQEYRTKVLEKGGSRDPALIMRDLIGTDKVSPVPFLRQLGLLWVPEHSEE
eukprot:TRINITY_DN2258_c0_g1_i1.p1 TRINITY_DN2258_c0_g1~~TRINITY_DN2258_c0_g1_i1.p1  ORF type:complete len:718 (+),score=86.12 TRINITY_DN2258_c0_g1_i1:89-2242(+)